MTRHIQIIKFRKNLPVEKSGGDDRLNEFLTPGNWEALMQEMEKLAK
jgi:hypothetical protein